MIRFLTACGLALALTGCKTEIAQNTTPVEMTAQTLGHYCQMNLLEHPGPKAQVHLQGADGMPLYFSQVRDAIAYLRAPEQSAPILAVYVNDMGREEATWDIPGDGNWIPAESAWFVVESRREGGMGAPETVPFADQQQAQDFAKTEGGRVLTLTDIPDDMVLAPVENLLPDDANPHSDHDSDFEDRLRALSRPAKG